MEFFFYAHFNDFLIQISIGFQLGFLVQCKEFRVKSFLIPPVEDKYINSFCWNLRDELDAYMSSAFKLSQNLSNKEKGGLKNLMRVKNKVICVNETDKNLGAANAGTGDVKAERCRQLYAAFTYQKLTEAQMNEFVRNVKFQLKSLVEKNLYKGNCSIIEANFLLSKIAKEFYCKFDSNLTDSTSLIRIVERTKFNLNCFLFTIDFKSLYSLIPVEDAIAMI